MSRRRWPRYVLSALALAGLSYAIVYTTVIARQAPPAAAVLAMPPESPYPATVSGSGLVEASSRNIAVGSFESGIVTAVPVIEGQRVAAGTPLFILDNRKADADLAEAERSVGAAEARVREAEAALADREDQFRRVRGLERGIVVSEDRQMRAEFAARTARAALGQAKAEVEVAHARAHTARVILDRLTVRAPVAGRVLKVNVRPGQFVVAGETTDPPVLFGDDQPLHVRVQIDENDIWRLKPTAAAEAVVRGNRALRFPLTFVRIEPYVLPKRSLTGDRTERIDTRVLEVLYSFDPGDRPMFIGQQVDVFIDAQ
jgi:RND family efflux transporter MFP subunit